MAQPPQQNTVVEHGRQPCPDRILDDIGGAFGMGAVGGGIWHACKGFINSPSSYKIKGTIEVCATSIGVVRPNRSLNDAVLLLLCA
jgi:hypothetical protein